MLCEAKVPMECMWELQLSHRATSQFRQLYWDAFRLHLSQVVVLAPPELKSDREEFMSVWNKKFSQQFTN